MFDTDKFITCIREKPALWDKSAKEYSDKNAREKAWIEVGENLYQEWAELDVNEREEKGKEMKCKWRHIRDNFLKYLNRGKSGDPAAKTKKYIYADALQFLLNTVEKRRTSGNIETTDSSETQGPSGNTVDEEEDHQVQPPSTSSGSGLQTPSRSASRQRQNERFTPFQSALLQKLDLTNTDQGDEDPDKIYIPSLLSDYKKLNDDEKMDFKFLTLDFFRNAQRRRSSHYSGINTSMQNFPPSTQSSMYVFSQPGSRSTDFSYQLPPSSYPIQGPYPTPSPTSMQPPSPMHRSSPSPSLLPLQRPNPMTTPSPTSVQCTASKRNNTTFFS